MDPLSVSRRAIALAALAAGVALGAALLWRDRGEPARAANDAAIAAELAREAARALRDAPGAGTPPLAAEGFRALAERSVVRFEPRPAARPAPRVIDAPARSARRAPPTAPADAVASERSSRTRSRGADFDRARFAASARDLEETP